MTDQDERLTAIEKRLLRIEETLRQPPLAHQSPASKPSTHGASPVNEFVANLAPQPDNEATTKPQHPSGVAETLLKEKGNLAYQNSKRRPKPGSAITTLMACGAALSFILAAAYFVGLAYKAGLLTPELQLGIALMSGLGLIVAGVVFAHRDRQYAAYMPAVGLIVLYLTVYAGHVHYHLIPDFAAMVIVAGISVGGILLGKRFDNSVYGVLAAAGVYVTPLLLGDVSVDLVGLMIYFTAWSLLFSFLSLQDANRTIYLVAMYMAMFCFDAMWRMSGDPSWAGVAIYQFAQFAIFGATAAYFSIRHKHALTDGETAAHALPLLFFYILEYILLKEHAAGLVPIAALISVGVLLGLYLFARSRLTEETAGSALTLVSTYCAAVTAHIVFFELLPMEYLPWAVLLLLPGLALMKIKLNLPSRAVGPVITISAMLGAWGIAVALASDSMKVNVPFPNAALLVYAAAIYLTYWRLTKTDGRHSHLPFVLYAAHVTFMVATIRIFNSGLLISVLWGIFAVVLLVVALKASDKVLGQSSLLVFTASAAKVLLHDLAGSPAPIRIGALLALGTSLYVGGWLYQNLVRETATYHSNPQLNQQIQTIAQLVREGLDNSQIVDHLIDSETECLHPDGWGPSMISDIRKVFDLG